MIDLSNDLWILAQHLSLSGERHSLPGKFSNSWFPQMPSNPDCWSYCQFPFLPATFWNYQFGMPAAALTTCYYDHLPVPTFVWPKLNLRIRFCSVCLAAATSCGSVNKDMRVTHTPTCSSDVRLWTIVAVLTIPNMAELSGQPKFLFFIYWLKNFALTQCF